MLTNQGTAPPPLQMPVAYVDWGLFYREISACVLACDDSGRTFGDIVCDAVEPLLWWKPYAFPVDPRTGLRHVAAHLPDEVLIDVGYVTDVDADGFVCCTVRRVRVVGGTVAAA